MSSTTPTSPAASTRAQRSRFWIRPVIFLLVLGLLLFIVSLILGFPAPVSLHFSGICAGVRLPQPDTLNLPVTQKMHLRGFNADLKQIRSATISGGGKTFSADADSFSLRPNPRRLTDPSSIIFSLSGRLGEDRRIALPTGSLIQGALSDNSSSALIDINPDNHACWVSSSAEGIDLSEINRMKADLKGLPGFFLDQETMRAQVRTSKGRLVYCLFESQADTGNKTITLWVPLQQTVPIWAWEIQSGAPVRLLSCQNSIVTLDGRVVSGIAKDAPLDITMSGPALSLRLMGMQLNKETKMWQLKVEIGGQVKSITVDGKERMPTKFDQMLKGTLVEKGFWGLLLLTLSYIVVTLSKRAIDTLANYLFPDPPDPGTP